MTHRETQLSSWRRIVRSRWFDVSGFLIWTTAAILNAVTGDALGAVITGFLSGFYCQVALRRFV